uniref:HpcH/HpaI aldolase/citrate lyase domain-containing protein n=1 Tax=Corethron hystrix TaxID=216773 RepID=A0A6U5GLL3_9STRA|mmetsp:Transcript_27309/g.62651  ORF Transcript_27309/g.62651 Transcript_27309/m.62651 type:complete len:107 (+) Transcript_27309:460-780(+)
MCAEANQNNVVGVVVETTAGIAAILEIIAAGEDMLDFVFIGPTDFSADMGLHGMIRHEKVLEAVERAGRSILDVSGGGQGWNAGFVRRRLRILERTRFYCDVHRCT